MTFQRFVKYNEKPVVIIIDGFLAGALELSTDFLPDLKLLATMHLA
jgi:hypothetical protein